MTRKPIRPNEEAIKAVMLLFIAFFLFCNNAKPQTLLLDFENGQQTIDNNCSWTMLTYFSNLNALSGSISLRTYWMSRNNAGPTLETPEFYTDGELFLITRAVSIHHNPYMWVYSIKPNIGAHVLVGNIQYTDTIPRTDTFKVSTGEFIKIYWGTNIGNTQPIPLWDQIIIDDIISYTPNACNPLIIVPDTTQEEIEHCDSCACELVYYSMEGRMVGSYEEYIAQPPGMYIKRCLSTGHANIAVKLK